MYRKQSPICPVKGCAAWMLYHPEDPENWLKCISCGFCKRITKRTINVIREKDHIEYANRQRKKRE